MQFIRQIYDDLPDFIPVPADLKHSKAEVIILPLESERNQQPYARQEKQLLKFMLDELAAINEIEPIEMECPNRVDRANPFLDENL
jgi:hypothetical protein